MLAEACALISPNDLDDVQVYKARVEFMTRLAHYPAVQAAMSACDKVLNAPCGCQARIRMRAQAWVGMSDAAAAAEGVPHLFECWGNREHVYPLVELVMTTLVHPR